MISVVAWLWHDSEYRFNHLFQYGRQHVEKLFAAVNENLSLPHENVLITDSPGDYANVDRIVPLWSDYRHLPGWRGQGHGCWHRLKAFDRETGLQLGKRFVWLDLDCVITGSLDPLFDRPEDFVAWKDSNPPTPYCGSMMMMDAGARQSVWDEFNRDHEAAMLKAKGLIGTDQAWIGRHLGEAEATWGPEDGVCNYKFDIVRRHNGQLPSNARIVFFTGACDPSQPELQEKHEWLTW